MTDEIKQIAQRLLGLREVLGATQEEMAKVSQIDLDMLKKAELGEGDISVGMLQNISRHYKIPLEVIMFGHEPHMESYYLTRKGFGNSIERNKAYSYEALSAGFINRKVDPFIVTVDNSQDQPSNIPLNTHEGQEFNLILEGNMEFQIGKKVLVLYPGDSIYYDCKKPHGMRSMEGKACRFLCVVI